MRIIILIVIWFVGAMTAGIALLIPIYNDYLIVGTIGWMTISISSGLIFYEMKRIRAEDKNKEMA